MIQLSRWFTLNDLMMNSKKNQIVNCKSCHSRQPVEMSGYFKGRELHEMFSNDGYKKCDRFKNSIINLS